MNEDNKEEKDDQILKERTEKALSFVKKRNVWVIGFLIIALILAVYIRSLPMQDHDKNTEGLQPGLWDITTNTWTLGPDLDPWFFTRYAETIVEQGSLPEIDEMRNVPLGFETSRETRLLPYMIAGTYYVVKVFNSDANVIFAAALFPVIMFFFTTLVFFLFVREIFTTKEKSSFTRANIIALIATFFMIVIPVFLSRTVAGIPEKESAAFFFMFISFYFFLKSWKSESYKGSLIYGSLAGISTGMMGLIWGGFIYVYVVMGLSTLASFILGKLKKKDITSLALWLFFAVAVLIFFSDKYAFLDLVKTPETGIAFFSLGLMIYHTLIWDTKFSKNNPFKKIKVPKEIISLVSLILIAVILAIIVFGPGFITSNYDRLIDLFVNPTTGRWGVTVAENRQPYFREWGNNFGPFIKNIPIMFWLFFIGSVLLFKEMIGGLKKKDSYVLSALYVFFFFGLVFSRYAPHPYILDGEGFISKLFYFGSALLLGLGLLYYYFQYYKEGNKGFEKVKFSYLLLFSLFVLCLFTARSAVRLIMVLGPVSTVFVGYIIVDSIDKFRKTKDDTLKMILGALAVLILVSSLFTFVTFYKATSGQAYGFIPSIYNQQWQKAMEWVRDDTPEDAVFAHWWDYGYWVQSIGKRATVLDGGNVIVYWNYLMGRLVLTGDNQADALEFLYNHDTTHLLIDSTDIGKYTAFSSIGSNLDYDRYSWIGTFLLDEKQMRETKNQTIYAYTGGIALDEDLVINQSGKEVLLPKQRAGVGAIILPMEKLENSTRFSQPYIIAFYNNIQYNVYLRYLSVGDQFVDFGSGIEAAAYIMPKLTQQGQGISNDPIGAAMYISPRLFRGMLSQIYILGDPLNRFPAFNLTHTEPSLIIDSIRSQGMDLPDFVYYEGIRGPIKIWEIEYTGEEEYNEEYLDKDYSNYIDWIL